jgi:rfaE bifunctional protein nucleotidyltransferase chain/domain
MPKPRTVFTNGCFDLLHPGHVDLLERARALGDRLVVGLNSDASVRRLKGEHKPYVNEADRRRMLLALRAVDEVVIFDEDTPLALIQQVQPDVLVKGGDWPVERIVGAAEVLARGGQVLSLSLLPGYSTTTIVEDIVHKAAGSHGVSPSAPGGSTR